MGREGDRLHLLYEVTRRLATFTDLDELLRYATSRTRELLDAEGSAVLLLDPARREFTFGVASQSEARQATSARLLEIRFPAHLGVAGWVLAHDEALAVADAQHDPRFYNGVDQVTNITTRHSLRTPARPVREHRGDRGDQPRSPACCRGPRVPRSAGERHRRGPREALRELPTRPGVVDGLVCVLLGALLSAAGRGWLSRRGAATRG